MNLDLTDEQIAFRDTTRRFIEAEAPVAGVRALADSTDAFDRAWWRRAAALGWTSVLAVEAGTGSGTGRSIADAAIVAEEMGRQVCPGPFCPVSVVTVALSDDGGRHGELLETLIDGSAVATWAHAERSGTWDGNSVETTAVPASDGIRVNGAKCFVEAASAAEQFLVTARTGDGLTQVLVPARSDGVTVLSGRSVDLARQFGTVRLDDVWVPSGSLVGPVGEAAVSVERQWQIAIALQCAETVGVLDRVFTFTLAYMEDRHTFGRPISSYQALKHRVADIVLWLESAKATTDALVAAIDGGVADAGRLASVAKAYVGEKSTAILQECVQFHGGIGVTWEHDIHLYLRRAAVNRAVYGTPEDHRARLFGLLGVGAP
jgi:alkylation response protein AidB-like acyl-CoA dehydrogenase